MTQHRIAHRTAFVLASAAGATLILNRNDKSISEEMLEYGDHDPQIGMLVCRLAMARRASAGDGVVIIDGGANLGNYTVLWSRFTLGWGQVIAFEPQRWPFYALCGNICINNCFNVEPRNEALATTNHEEMIAAPAGSLDPTQAQLFGSHSLIGATGPQIVRCVAIDELRLPRLDILKLDLEGMEPAAIEGARVTIQTQRPIIVAEHPICGHQRIMDLLPDYEFAALGNELLCVHAHEHNEQLTDAMREIVRQLTDGSIGSRFRKAG